MKFIIKTNPYPYEIGIDLKQEILKIENALIKDALFRTKGNGSKAARSLGISRATLESRCKVWDIRYEK